MKRANPNGGPPWGRAAGLGVACAATLAGVAGGLEPETILRRAVIAAVVSGLAVWLWRKAVDFSANLS